MAKDNDWQIKALIIVSVISLVFSSVSLLCTLSIKKDSSGARVGLVNPMVTSACSAEAPCDAVCYSAGRILARGEYETQEYWQAGLEWSTSGCSAYFGDPPQPGGFYW